MCWIQGYGGETKGAASGPLNGLASDSSEFRDTSLILRYNSLASSAVLFFGELPRELYIESTL